MCGSGLQAIINAAQEIALGDADVVLAGGIENMDQAPFLMPKGRYGYRMGMPDAKILDHMVFDGLWDVFNDYHMGVTAENVAERYGITREDCDAYAARSHQLAAKAHGEESLLRPDRARADQAEEADGRLHHRRAHPARRHRGGPGAAAAGVQEGRPGHRGQRQRRERRRGADAGEQRGEGARSSGCRSRGGWCPRP